MGAWVGGCPGIYSLVAPGVLWQIRGRSLVSSLVEKQSLVPCWKMILGETLVVRVLGGTVLVGKCLLGVREALA